MKNVITHLHVDEPVGTVHPGGMVILSGEAPVWSYCNLFHKCVMEGAAVIAIAHGIDTTTNADASIVAYSTDADYQIGKTIGQSEKNELLSRFIEKFGAEEGLRRYQAGENLHLPDELSP